MAPRKSTVAPPTRKKNPPPPPRLSLAQLYQDELPTRQCKTCTWVETLDEDDRAWLDNQFKVEENLTKLWRACVKAGLNVARSSLYNHVVNCLGGYR
jgi:hypothetical protein